MLGKYGIMESSPISSNFQLSCRDAGDLFGAEAVSARWQRWNLLEKGGIKFSRKSSGLMPRKCGILREWRPFSEPSVQRKSRWTSTALILVGAKN